MQSHTLVFDTLVRYSLRIAWIIALITTLTGCMFKNKVLAQRSLTIEPIEIVTEHDLTTKWRGKLGVLPFSGPAYAGDQKEKLSSIYFEKLLKNGPFRQTLLVPREAKSDEDALRLGRDSMCDAVLRGAIDYALDSTGASPTALEVHIRVLEVNTGLLLAYFRQRGHSLPGADVDLYWTVINGNPAVRLDGLADLLAEQASQQLNALTWRSLQ